MELKYNFTDDYSEGCHPTILKKLTQHNFVQKKPYGFDELSLKAKDLIHQAIKTADSQIYFVSGGTQANLITIAASLRPHQAVISAGSGHIFNREAGAIEATGHKIITANTQDGKLKPADVESILNNHLAYPHVVKPKLVYISNANEFGLIYTRLELTELSEYCKQNHLYLLVDGALPMALCSDDNDVSLQDMAKLTDAFTIGGTKNGALLGEAIVLNQIDIFDDFNFHIKQRGALLAKGSLLGVQFLSLFENDLYKELALHANAMAKMMSDGIQTCCYRLLHPVQTNQIFVILPNAVIATLQQHYGFYVRGEIDEQHSVIRLLTSWATPQEKVAEFIGILEKSAR